MQAFRTVAMWDTAVLGARPITFVVRAQTYINGSLSPAPGVIFKNDQFGLTDLSFAQLLQWPKFL